MLRIPKPQAFWKSLLSYILHENNMPKMLVFYSEGTEVWIIKLLTYFFVRRYMGIWTTK
jgi:hypothetical protein